jgi:hypothetical protein
MAKDKVIEKALKEGLLTKKQYDKLPDKLLLGIAKSKMGKPKVDAKGKKKYGTKEERHKLGKQAHKAGRPKKGSKVEVAK